VSGPPSTLDLITQTIAARHGTLYAERWLSAQQSKAQGNLPEVQGAVSSHVRNQPHTPQGNLSEPIRPCPTVSPADIAVSPAEARKTALSRLEAKAEAMAEKLRERVGFHQLSLRSDRRRRLERFHTRLVLYALVVALKKGYRKACTITVHTVMELVGYCLGIKSSSTLYSYLHALKNLGLIDFKGHVTTVSLKGADGETYEANRCDGALLCVRLDGFKKAQLSRFDFQETLRDLQADMRRGHTAYRLLQQFEESKTLEEEVDITPLIFWSLNSSNLFSPLKPDSSGFAGLLEQDYPTGILDLANSKDRNHDVNLTAHAIARYLGDASSLNFYRLLLWQLLRAKDRGWDFFGTVYHAVVRVMADKRERFARQPGALLVARLKVSAYWDELWRDQNQWVGRPVVA
jgi:Fe2+ or Zn2+ uptake regulation protein